MLDTESLKKIIEALQRIQPEASEEQLGKIAKDLYEISLYLVHLKVKEHSKKQDERDFTKLVEKPPP